MRNVSQQLDDAVRQIVARNRASAFDNVDLEKLLGDQPLSPERVAWIGHHLLKAGRNARSFADGQEILRQLEDGHYGAINLGASNRDIRRHRQKASD